MLLSYLRSKSRVISLSVCSLASYRILKDIRISINFSLWDKCSNRVDNKHIN